MTFRGAAEKERKKKKKAGVVIAIYIYMFFFFFLHSGGKKVVFRCETVEKPLFLISFFFSFLQSVELVTSLLNTH